VWTIQKSLRGLPVDGEYGFLRYASSTLINHLKVCSRQSEATRARARHILTASPKKQNHSGSTHSNVQLPWPQFGPGTSHHSPPLPQMLPPSIPSTRACSPAASISSLSAFPSPYAFLTTPPNGDILFSPARSYASLPTIARSRSQSILIDDSGVWSPEFQKKFEERITRITVAAGLPLSWVDNPEWIDFINDFLPFARSPSRKVLTNRLIPTAAKHHRELATVAAKNQNATLQADGWTGINFHHLLAFMISFNKQVCSVLDS
jgi:hypothetical protein